MIRILKKSRHDFSGKHLCDRYCVDIMRGGQDLVIMSYGFVKLLLEFVT